MAHSRPKVIDLFAGVGGFSLGAERAGFDVVGAVDNDHDAIHAHGLNFPRTNHASADLSSVDGDMLATLLGTRRSSITGIIGGPPCQGFSAMGKNNPADPRNSLYGRFFYYVNEFKPEFFVVENVPGILGVKFKNIISESMKIIANEYTVCKPLILCAKDYGVPTTRTRAFIIGFKKKKRGKGIFELRLQNDAEPVTVKDALRGLPLKIEMASNMEGYWRKIGGFPNGQFGERVRGNIPHGVGSSEAVTRLKTAMEVSGFTGTAHTQEVVERFARTRPGEAEPISRYWRLERNGFCPTLRAGTGRDRGSFQAARPIHPTEDRVITVREAARLQGFPDWFLFSTTKWASFRQIGNSVCPIVAERLLSQIIFDLD